MGTSLGVPDTMTAIAPKLNDLVPFACVALFLHDEETATLRCRFAIGHGCERSSSRFRCTPARD